MHDLLAIAIIRRLLLDLGLPIQPDEVGQRIGSLGLWITMPRADLDGLTPSQVLDENNGRERVGACLAALFKPLGADAARET